MIQPCATISLIPEARGGPFLFWDDLASACEKAAALGFSAVEIFAPSPDSLDTGKIRQLLESHGLKLAALGSGGGWILHQWHIAHEDSGVRVHAREFGRLLTCTVGAVARPANRGQNTGPFFWLH